MRQDRAFSLGIVVPCSTDARTRRLYPHDLHDPALVEEARALESVETGEEGLDHLRVLGVLIHRWHDVGGGPPCAAAVTTATTTSPRGARPTSRLLVRARESTGVGVLEAPAE